MSLKLFISLSLKSAKNNGLCGRRRGVEAFKNCRSNLFSTSFWFQHEVSAAQVAELKQENLGKIVELSLDELNQKGSKIKSQSDDENRPKIKYTTIHGKSSILT